MSRDLTNEELVASADPKMDKIRINVYTEGTVKVKTPMVDLDLDTIQFSVLQVVHCSYYMGDRSKPGILSAYWPIDLGQTAS